MTAAEVDPWSLPAYPERVGRALVEIQRVVAILTGTDSVSHECSDTTGENSQHAPEVHVGARTTAPGRLAPSLLTNGADPMMVAPLVSVHADCRQRHAEDADTIRRLRTDLARAIRQRDANAKHWYVGDPAGYCLACGLIESNGRHCSRIS